MDQRIKPKPNRAANIVYGDVHEAEEVVDAVERLPLIKMSEAEAEEILRKSNEEIKDLTGDAT